MPGIFDVLAANGILSSLFGPAAQPTDTGDDTQRMLNRQKAVLSGQGSVTNPVITNLPVTENTPPVLSQVMNNQAASYLPPDAEREIAQSEIDPRTIPANRDPYTNTYNADASAFQDAMKQVDSQGNFNKWVRAADLVGKGLMAAGSPDPAKTLAMFQSQDADLNRTKVTPLADGAFSLIQEPGKPPRTVLNSEVAKYLGDQQQSKFEQALQKVILSGRVQGEVAGTRAAVKSAEEARPLLNSTTSLFNRWTEAQRIVSGQATNAPNASKIQGAVPGIAGFFGGDQVAANKFLQGLAVDETLLRTAETKGAISNAEMELFKSPLPSLTDDREKVWKPFIQERLKVLEKLQKYYEGEVARGAPGASPAPPNPAPANRSGMSVPGLSDRASKYFQ